MSRRNIGMNIGLGIAALCFGLWLETAPFPLNYQVMFLFAFVMALCSQMQLMHVKVKPVPVAAPRRKSEFSPLRSHGFQKTLFVAVIIHISFFALVPVTPLRLVESLGADEGFMALFGLAEIGAAALISLFTSRIAHHLGNRRMVAFALLGTGAAALILASAQNLPVTLLAGAISGASWTAASIGLYGLFFESTHDVSDAEIEPLHHNL